MLCLIGSSLHGSLWASAWWKRRIILCYLMCLKLLTSGGQLCWTWRSKVTKPNSTLIFVNPRTKTLTLVCQNRFEPQPNAALKFPRASANAHFQIPKWTIHQHHNMATFSSTFFFGEAGWFNINRLVPVDKMTNQIHRAYCAVKWYEWKK